MSDVINFSTSLAQYLDFYFAIIYLLPVYCLIPPPIPLLVPQGSCPLSLFRCLGVLLNSSAAVALVGRCIVTSGHSPPRGRRWKWVSRRDYLRLQHALHIIIKYVLSEVR